MAALPTRFPCWCRAVYSWGGETEKDLGFVEGDLIECLNAGDGSWWMGRLRRDRRMMGLFPSNFVTVLGDDFTPISRSTSPMSEMTRTDSGKNSISNLEKKKEKAKSRRPFQGYKNPAPVKTANTASIHTQITTPVQPPRQSSYNPSNPPSTVLWQQRPVSRGPSRSPSPMPHHEIGSSPPPPPPPHRITMGNNISRQPSPQPPRSHSPLPPHMHSLQISEPFPSQLPRAISPRPQMFDMNDRYRMIQRTPSPAAASLNGHTPPMLRDAMDSVMLSLDGMGLGRSDSDAREEEEIPQQEPFNPWSPEAFSDLQQNVTRPPQRPLTSNGFQSNTNHFSEPRPSYSSRHNSPDRSLDAPAHLETYVERMERQLRARAESRQGYNPDGRGSEPPDPPPKTMPWTQDPTHARILMNRRKSAYELGGVNLNRTYTTKTSSTDSSSGAKSVATTVSNVSSKTSQSLMSGYSAGGFSATSAGSLARRNLKMESMNEKVRPMTSSGTRNDSWDQGQGIRPLTPATGVSYHSSNDSRAGARSAAAWTGDGRPTSSGGLGGLTTPKAKKAGLWKKFTDGSKTAFASARSTIVPATDESISRSASPTKSNFGNPITGFAGGLAAASPIKKDRKTATSNGTYGRDAAREMGLASGSSNSWVTARRDVHRSNTPAPPEKQERAERCQMLNEPVIYPIEELYETLQGDEGANGSPVYQSFQLSNPSFSLVDKAARFITSLPSSITASNLATAYVCRPYRSDVQRLRAIFIWCSERVSWDSELGFQGYQNDNVFADTRKVIQSRRGNSKEIAFLVMEMCKAIGLHAEVVQGYLKSPGEELDLDAATPSKANHWWNSVLVDKEWRMMDACIASPTHPKRALYSSVSPSIAEAWYFLSKPSEICWTHVPVAYEQQHIVPPTSSDTLLALPGACPPFFQLGLGIHNYDTSLLRLEGLEVCTLSVIVPIDVEVVAEVEARSYLRDQDGDFYEDSDRVSKKRALSQANWYQIDATNPDSLQKRYIIKGVLPGDERNGTLKIYAGRKGLMHSSRDIVHPLALAVPLYHTGDNPAYEFVRRHPTIHATRQDLYVVQPQCYKLAAGETYVFCVRQHPASVIPNTPTPQSEQGGFDFRPLSPNPLNRPASALSMTSSTAHSQQGSDSSTTVPGSAGVKVKDKPAKLAIQSPGGKIIRLSRKSDYGVQSAAAKELDGTIVGSMWESVVKIGAGERGTWRGLVLADRSARWCVWGEWECE